DEGDAGVLGPRPLRLADGDLEVLLIPAAHALDPAGVPAVELRERLLGGRGVVPAHVVRGRAAEVGVAAHGEHAHDDVAETPGDGGGRGGGAVGVAVGHGVPPGADREQGWSGAARRRLALTTLPAATPGRRRAR